MTGSPDRSARAAICARRRRLAPDTHAAFEAFSRQVFAAGALDTETKQLIAVAVAHAGESSTPRDTPESD